jgi:hypothetical protein
MAGSPARLSGRWRVRWSKFHGPFLLETDDPGAALEFPLVGVLRGLGYEAGPDGATLEIHDGVRQVAVLDTRGAAPRPLYAAVDVPAVGPGPVRVRAASGGWLRLFGVCFTEPQPWLPRTAALDAERLVAAFDTQAARGAIS